MNCVMSKITIMNVLNKAFSYKKEKYSCNGYDIRIRIVFKLIQCIISVFISFSHVYKIIKQMLSNEWYFIDSDITYII